MTAAATPPLVPDRLASGRLIDLAACPRDFDFHVEIALPLGRIGRFAGQAADAEGSAYSVGEHSVRGGEALYRETGSASAALAFLLHDAHEVLGGDFKRPFVDLIELIAARDGLAPGGLVRRAIEAAKAEIDAAIHAAAGLAWPLPAEWTLAVRQMDERMAAEEMRRFWPDAPLPGAYRQLARVPGPAPHQPCWSPRWAADQWMERFHSWSAARAVAAGEGDAS